MSKGQWTITSVDKRQLNQPSSIIVHTATSCHTIDKIIIKYITKDYEKTLEDANNLVKLYNDFLANPGAIKVSTLLSILNIVVAQFNNIKINDYNNDYITPMTELIRSILPAEFEFKHHWLIGYSFDEYDPIPIFKINLDKEIDNRTKTSVRTRIKKINTVSFDLVHEHRIRGEANTVSFPEFDPELSLNEYLRGIDLAITENKASDQYARVSELEGKLEQAKKWLSETSTKRSALLLKENDYFTSK